jgi:N-acetylneuraminic acid mutarotase
MQLSQRYEPPLPEPREEVGSAATARRFYVIGGFDVAGRSRAEVYVFDGDSWTAGPALPFAVNHPAAAALGGSVYESGGFAAGATSSRVFRLDVGAASWQEIAPMHHARAAHALVADGRFLYAIGGRTGSGLVASTERYDPTDNTWTDLEPVSTPRHHVAGFVEHGMSCIAGGRAPATTAAIDCFDPRTTHWIRRGALPMRTSGAGVVFLGTTLIAAGGEDARETSLVNTVSRLVDGHWQSQAMLEPRHSFAYAIFHGRIWACGGGNAPGLHPVATCTSIAG